MKLNKLNGNNERHIAVGMDASGIAALLLKGGRTVHLLISQQHMHSYIH